jgi:hypothetical protein
MRLPHWFHFPSHCLDSDYDLFPVTIDLVISATTIYDRDSVFERVITQLAVADPSR